MKDSHPIFRPLKVSAERQLASRLFLAPINTGFAIGGLPTDDLRRFYVDRSSPANGITMIGNVATSPHLASNASTAVLSVQSFNRFRDIAREIDATGGAPGIQLAEAPRSLAPKRSWRVKHKDDELARLKGIVADLDAREISEAICNFIEAAARATEAEFQVIQIHAAHGYLLSLLLNACTNERRDTFEMQGDWLAEFVTALRSTIGDKILLSFRINAYAGIQAPMVELHEAIELARRLAGCGVDLIDLSAGFYTFDRNLIYPCGKTSPALPYYDAATAVAGSIATVVAFAGNVRDVRLLPDPLPTNIMVGAARAFIADPEFAIKSAEGRFDEIIACSRCNQCHYFTRGKIHIECGVNPNLPQK